VSNVFVAMATWVGPFKISLTLLDSFIPKSPAKHTNLGDISYTRRVIDDFFLKFRCHGNRGWSRYNLVGVIQ